MTQEVIRRHYLEAMGITAWAAKYQLPNALPTESCEWEEPMPDKTPPRERLQALLDDAPSPRRPAAKPQAPEPHVSGDVAASPAAVRALLINEKSGAEKADLTTARLESAPETNHADAPLTSGSVAKTSPAQPLVFSLSCLCIGGRWLVMQADEMPALEHQLLANLLFAVGIHESGELPQITRFKWPQMTNAFAVEDPLEEAREGMQAFIAGCVSRQGWQLEQLLWWGELGPEQAPLDRLFNVSDGLSHTLSLPVWQGPALATILEGANSKRELWPAIHRLGQQWVSTGAISAELSADDH